MLVGCLQDYAFDFQTLAIIELLVIGAFEYKRFENIKKTGEVRSSHYVAPSGSLPLSFTVDAIISSLEHQSAAGIEHRMSSILQFQNILASCISYFPKSVFSGTLVRDVNV